MKYPNFFTDIKIILKDPLADILGVFENGIIEYSYLDIVKFSGHSCPTVAGAFLMTKIGLQNLYQNNIPIRGDIKVEIKNKKDNGITGVIANIVTFITGASDNGGFKGLNGNFARDNLISFDNEFNGIIKLTSISQNKTIELDYNPNSILPNPKQTNLMQKVFQKNASNEEIKEFGKLWQDRVKEILFNPNKVIIITN